MSSDYILEKSQFGLIRTEFIFGDSIILNQSEQLNLIEMTESKSCELVYRATRDSFTAYEFHSKCDYKPNLVSIIRNNLNYIFGGYTSVAWNKNSSWVTDRNAFIFSLRRNGVTKNDKFMVQGNGEYAFYGNEYYHLWYGRDIHIIDLSHINRGSYCEYGACYQSAAESTFNTNNSRSLLAGNYDQWLTTEIEVYEIKFV
jgi:hypothetical protein